jgi:hypothetical protein
VSIFIQSYVITTTYKCQQNKCYPRKHLKSGKRDEKNNKLIENKNVNRIIKKREGGM